MSDAGVVEFGDPDRAGFDIYTIHSEQATFPASFGAREVSFQLSLNPAFLERIRLLTDLGLASTSAIEVHGQSVVPRALLIALLARLPRTSPSLETFGIHRIEAYGEAGTAVVECLTRAVPRLAFGGGVLSTACPPGVVANMIVAGELDARGVLPSERAVPFAPLFERLRALRRVGHRDVQPSLNANGSSGGRSSSVSTGLPA